MAIEIEKTTNKNAKEIKEWLHQHLKPTLDRKLPSQNLDVKFFDDENKIKISNKKIDGEIIIKDNYLKGVLKLPLLYRAFSSTIKSAINDVLKDL